MGWLALCAVGAHARALLALAIAGVAHGGTLVLPTEAQAGVIDQGQPTEAAGAVIGQPQAGPAVGAAQVADGTGLVVAIPTGAGTIAGREVAIGLASQAVGQGAIGAGCAAVVAGLA